MCRLCMQERILQTNYQKMLFFNAVYILFAMPSRTQNQCWPFSDLALPWLRFALGLGTKKITKFGFKQVLGLYFHAKRWRANARCKDNYVIFLRCKSIVWLCTCWGISWDQVKCKRNPSGSVSDAEGLPRTKPFWRDKALWLSLSTKTT